MTPARVPATTRGASDLRVEGLSVVLDTPTRQRTIVSDVSFEVHPGQTLGIVGESGSGKTMTARAVLGLLPDGLKANGTATFGDYDLLRTPERALRSIRGTRISMLLQDPFTSLNPLQSVASHIGERLLVRGRSARQTQIDKRIDEVGLDPAEVAGRYPFQLSGGMRQRVALAAALAGDPELLIADEPTTALDVTTQLEILRMLKQLQSARGMALVLITHDLSLAFSVCDRVLVMYAGSVVEDGSSSVVVDSPAHPYSLGLLLAEPPLAHYVADLSAIPGSVPSADEVTNGCAFANRCLWVRSDCTAERPALTEMAPDHSTRCVRVAEIGEEMALRRTRVNKAAAPPEIPAGTPMLVVDGLTKEYRTRRLVGRSESRLAVKDVSFHVLPGESVGLVGETGSGKTTVARCILGLTRSDAGTISLSGRDISDFRRLERNELRQVRRFVQVVFQDPFSSLNPALTVGSALREALMARGEGVGSQDAVAELLDLVALPSDYSDRRPAALSGGERQRVAIARALAMQPRLLICDEPVASLDVSAQAQVLTLLREIRSKFEMAMLFITHDLSVVRQMTDRVVVLYNGSVVETGSTSSVLDSPRHAYTVRLRESAGLDLEVTAPNGQMQPLQSPAEAYATPGPPDPDVGIPTIGGSLQGARADESVDTCSSPRDARA